MINSDIITNIYPYLRINEKYYLALCCQQFFKVFKTHKHNEIVELKYYQENLEKVANIIDNNPNFKFSYETGSQYTKVPQLKILKNLYQLKITYKYDCQDLSFLKNSNIKKIIFDRCANIIDIESLNYVENIDIYDSAISSDLSMLIEPKSLSFFDIKTKIEKWPRCKNLESLDICYMPFGRSILKKSLISLSLSVTEISKKDLIKISKLKNLRYLCMRDTNISDISIIASLDNLKKLDIAMCSNIKDVSMLTKLKELDIFGCINLDPDEVKKQLPNVKLTF